MAKERGHRWQHSVLVMSECMRRTWYFSADWFEYFCPQWGQVPHWGTWGIIPPATLVGPKSPAINSQQKSVWRLQVNRNTQVGSVFLHTAQDLSVLSQSDLLHTLAQEVQYWEHWLVPKWNKLATNTFRIETYSMRQHWTRVSVLRSFISGTFKKNL